MLYSDYVFFVVDDGHTQFCTRVGNQPRHANVCLRASLHVGPSRSNNIQVMISNLFTNNGQWFHMWHLFCHYLFLISPSFGAWKGSALWLQHFLAIFTYRILPNYCTYPISAQSSNSVVFRLLLVYLYLLLYKGICCGYTFELHRLVPTTYVYLKKMRKKKNTQNIA